MAYSQEMCESKVLLERNKSSHCNPHCEEILLKDLTFNENISVFCSRCMGHNKRGQVTYLCSESLHRVPLVITRWILNFDVNASQDVKCDVLNQIKSIEQSLNSMKKINHKFMAQYLGLNFVISENRVSIEVLQEYVSGCTMKKLFSKFPASISRIHFISSQILETLSFMHKNSIVHENLRESSVFINEEGNIKIIDYSLDKRLHDLYRNINKHKEAISFSNPTICKSEKKGDIYQLGLLLLRLVGAPLNTPVIIPKNVNPRFADFLKMCLLEDEQKRWSADELLSHAFITTPLIYESMTSQIEFCDGQEDNIEFSQGTRIENEFEKINLLGEGGFGIVWKVRNKLDSRVYAVKRIVLSNNEVLNKKTKREVKLLSKLNHENIVRYFHSWIEAVPDEESSESDYTSKENSEIDDQEIRSSNKIRKFMYIQMEYCESTLDEAIQIGLHNDVTLVWKLFREIVEGLDYLHQQNVIHRDLKPGNIFLDSRYRAKIGDFGLATILNSNDSSLNDFKSSGSDTECSQTKHVGTDLYVAPEVSTGKTYTQKVDIYSLGILFFEMCYPPIEAHMEHVHMIKNLRLEEIKFPDNAKMILSVEMIQVITWLLQHDAAKRPNSDDLIRSKFIQPLIMEETELKMLLPAVSNPQSRIYKHIINALFKQEVSSQFELTYGIDGRSQKIKSKNIQVCTNIIDSLIKIMRLHGAVNFSVPLFMPINSIAYYENSVLIMERGGGIISLPFNLRVPFARYIARRELCYLKRYSLEKVFRQQKVCHPRELYELAFDIVTSSNSFLPDAEVIASVSHVIDEFPALKNRQYYIRLNHVSLFKSILLYCDIDEEFEIKIYKLIEKHQLECLTPSILENNFTKSDLNAKSFSKLLQFIQLEEDIQEIEKILEPVINHDQATCLVKSSLEELNTIVNLARSFGVNLNIFICPGLVQDIRLFSGMLFQCICNIKTKHKNFMDVLAVGGRFNNLIKLFQKKTSSESRKSSNQTGVGVSIAVESIVNAEIKLSHSNRCSVADVLIHSEDIEMENAKASLLQELWKLDVRAMVLHDNLKIKDSKTFCKKQFIDLMVILRKEDPNHFKVYNFQGGETHEQFLPKTEFLRKCVKNKTTESTM